MSLPIEIPIFSSSIPPSALSVSRIELNNPLSYPLGGLTPSPAVLRAVLPLLPASTTLTVMIRPRGPPPSGSDFLYTPAELHAMHAAITSLRPLLPPGPLPHGFVFGALSTAHTLCTRSNAMLVAAAGGAPCTLHRAIDQVLARTPVCAEALRAVVADITACGFAAVLTSGGAGDAVENLSRLAVFCSEARAVGLRVIIGGGVRSASVQRIREAVGAGTGVVVHSSCMVGREFSEEELQRLVEECK